MKTIVFCLLTTLMMSCNFKPMSEVKSNPEAGFNGSFEDTVDGLPANWYIYTPENLTESEFQILTGSEGATDGQQALQFDVTSCSGKSGRFSPGFFTEIAIKEPGIYTVTFSVKNEEANCVLTTGGVSAKKGHTKEFLIAPGSQRQFSADAVVKEDDTSLRIEFNVLSPGKVFVDNIIVKGPQGFHLN